MIELILKDRSATRIRIAEQGKTLRGFSETIGISHPYLSQILNGQRNPSPTVGFKIANGIGCSIEDIFFVKTVAKVNQ